MLNALQGIIGSKVDTLDLREKWLYLLVSRSISNERIMKIVTILTSGFFALSLLNAAPAAAQVDEDWVVVENNVRFVNFDKAESKRGSLYLNTINGRYAAEMDIDKYWHWVEESDRPGYKFMTNFGSDFFTRWWYFNSDVIDSLPPVDGRVFVALSRQ